MKVNQRVKIKGKKFAPDSFGVIAAVVEHGEYPDAIFMQKNNLSHYNFSPEYNTPQKTVSFIVWSNGRLYWVLKNKLETTNETFEHPTFKEDLFDLIERMAINRRYLCERAGVSYGNYKKELSLGKRENLFKLHGESLINELDQYCKELRQAIDAIK
jgi:hypothetical protein